MLRRERLESVYILPSDASDAVLVGRVWSNAAGGPCPVLIRDGKVLDLTVLSPTVSGLFEIEDLAERLAIGRLSQDEINPESRPGHFGQAGME